MTDRLGIFDIDPTLFMGDFAEYAKELGYVTWAWNALHADLADLFFVVSGLPDAATARAIWYSQKSDKGAREMLEAVASARLKGHTNLLTELGWFLDEIGKTSAFRNDAFHVLWTTEPSPVTETFLSSLARTKKAIPDTVRGTTRTKRLVGKDAQKIFRALANYSHELGQFSRSLIAHVDNPNLGEPLPRRPSRPSVLPDDPGNQNTRPRNPAKQKRQPRPSRASRRS